MILKQQIDWSKVTVPVKKLEPGAKRQDLRLDKVTASPYKPKGEIARLNAIAAKGKVAGRLF